MSRPLAALARAVPIALALVFAWTAPASAQITASYVGATPDTADGTTYTLNNVPIGTAAADRDIGMIVYGRKSGGSQCTLTSTTLNGSSVATLPGGTVVNNATNCNLISVRTPTRVTTGTTATIVLTFPGTMLRVDVKVFRMAGSYAPTAATVVSSTAGDPTGSVTIAANGVGLGVAMTAANTTTTWSGLTETDDTVVESAITTTSALLTPGTLQSGITVTADFAAAGVESVGIFVSWAPLVNASSPTHFVTSGGNASSNCDVGDPCTLTRAFALAGTATMPGGSWVSVAAGVYSQAGITTTGGGTAAFPIRFVGTGTDYTTGSRLSAGRTSLPASSWTLSTNCGGTCTYTYETPFDEASLYTVGMVSQRPPVSTWVPILVDDRTTPFTTPSGRSFYLDEPVHYTERFSVADVELQHCTFYHSTSANELYIHPCREGAPSDADNYYAGPDNWGNITYTGNGDYLTLEGFTVEHVWPRGIDVENSSTGVHFENIRSLSSQLWFRGVGTTGEDLFVKEVITQNEVHAQCYSAQYGGGGLPSRSCFNALSDGYGIVWGEDGTGFSYNGVYDRITLERGWNGVAIQSNHIIDHMTIWGFGNHAIISSGPGVTLTNSIMVNAQDGIFEADEDWESHVYENNIFYGGTLFYCGRDGVQGSVSCPTSWTFRSNIFATMISDVHDEATVDRDCNIWMPRNGTQALLRVYQTNGSIVDYTTLGAIQAAFPTDDNTVFHPHTSWTDGSIFANFTSQENDLDFSLASGGEAALTTCGSRAGPDTLGDEAPGPPATNRFKLPRKKVFHKR